MKRVKLLAIAFCMVLFAMALPLSGEARAEGRVILVVDSSGSMWGQIDGTAKVTIAREVIGGLLDSWDQSTDLGIIAYGHRRKGDCGDIETVLPVGSLDPGAAREVINGLQPRGKTPLSDAVRKAAEELRFTEEKATVILVSDGLETCDADPCAVASELEASGVDFTAHVIGFGLKSGEAEQLACLAENTGGRFLSAANANELTQALETTVQQVQQEVVQTQPEPEAEPAGPQGLKVEAVLAEGMEPIEDELFWWVLDDEADINGKRAEITYSGAASPLFELPAERYVLRVRHGAIFRDVEVTVAPKELTRVRVVLDGGYLRLTAIPTEGADPLADDMFYWVYSPDKDINGNRTEITYGGSATQLFRLPAGRYHIVARHGNAWANADIEIAAGKLLDHVFDMNVAYLRLSAVPTQGAEPLSDDMFYWVYAPEKDLNGNRAEITYGGSATPLFKLPAGRYHVVARHGSAWASLDVDLTAGTLSEETFEMNAGYLRLSAELTEGEGALEDDLFYWVYSPEKDINGNRKEITYGGSATQLFKLPAGRYHVVARHGSTWANEELLVTAGSLNEHRFNLNGGIVRLEAVYSGESEPIGDDLFWWVNEAQADLNGNHKEIAYGGSAAQIFKLPAGTYQLVVRHQGVLTEGELIVAAGDLKVVQVELSR